MLLAGCFCGLEDLGFGQPEVRLPAPYMLSGWPTLPPAGEGAVGVKAQRCQQRPEKLFIDDFARSRVLLLLYWFT